MAFMNNSFKTKSARQTIGEIIIKKLWVCNN